MSNQKKAQPKKAQPKKVPMSTLRKVLMATSPDGLTGEELDKLFKGTEWMESMDFMIKQGIVGHPNYTTTIYIMTSYGKAYDAVSDVYAV